MVWAELTISNARKLLVCFCYRPHPDDDTSLPLLNESLCRINPNSKSIVIVGGEFNLGYMKASHLCSKNIPSVITGKPNLQQHKLFLDIINDHSLTQLVNIPTRQDKILDRFLTNYPSLVNKSETMPPIGVSDHDIVFTECVTSLRMYHAKPRNVLQFSKANWDQINEDITRLHEKILHEKDSSTVEQLWNDFKTSLSKTLSENIPEKVLNMEISIGSQMISDVKSTNWRKKMVKWKKKIRQILKNDNIKSLKSKIQKEQREAYWKYIEKMIFDIHLPIPTLIKHSLRSFLKSYSRTLKPRKLRILLFLHLGKMVSWRVTHTHTPSQTSLINRFTKSYSCHRHPNTW